MSRSMASPFAIPNDEEVLRFYESERAKRSSILQEGVNASRIWEKKTASQRH